MKIQLCTVCYIQLPYQQVHGFCYVFQSCGFWMDTIMTTHKCLNNTDEYIILYTLFYCPQETKGEKKSPDTCLSQLNKEGSVRSSPESAGQNHISYYLWHLGERKSRLGHYECVCARLYKPACAGKQTVILLARGTSTEYISYRNISIFLCVLIDTHLELPVQVYFESLCYCSNIVCCFAGPRSIFSNSACQLCKDRITSLSFSRSLSHIHIQKNTLQPSGLSDAYRGHSMDQLCLRGLI